MTSEAKIAHLTSAHLRYDTRIFHKMCTSLARHGHSVTLIVADGRGDEWCNGVRLLDVGASKGRRDRILNSPTRVFSKALKLDADLYHLHDPELIPIGLKLKKLGKRVIFDSHEDVPKQMLSKPYLNKFLLWIISVALKAYEIKACKNFDGIIAATPFIRDKFLLINPNTIDINNFPLEDELSSQTSWSNKIPAICYVGGIEEVRGIVEVIQAMELGPPSVRLKLAGKFVESDLVSRLESMPGWRCVDNLGWLNRNEVCDVLSECVAGLVTLHPVPNYVDAQPIKMFEYMSSGIPVIASDFPLWRQIIAGNDCGLLVNPFDPVQISGAINYLVTHLDEAERMGRNGRRAVIEKYNWSAEVEKLFLFYESILNRG